MSNCICLGPQDGAPVCPCEMQDVKIIDGRYVKIVDLGKAPMKSGLPYIPEKEKYLRTDLSNDAD